MTTTEYKRSYENLPLYTIIDALLLSSRITTKLIFLLFDWLQHIFNHTL